MTLRAPVRTTEVNSRRSVFCFGPLDLSVERLHTNLRRGVHPQRETNIVLSGEMLIKPKRVSHDQRANLAVDRPSTFTSAHLTATGLLL